MSELGVTFECLSLPPPRSSLLLRRNDSTRMSRRPSTASSLFEHKHRPSRDIPLPAPLIMRTPSDVDVEVCSVNHLPASTPHELLHLKVPTRTARPKSSKGRQHISPPDHLTLQDRTIIAEIESRPKPRQFFVNKNGKKHHSFSPKDIPYPRSYERSILDQYVSMTSYLQSAYERSVKFGRHLCSSRCLAV